MEKMPAATLPPSRSHAPLAWLIRGTGALIAIFFGLMLAFYLIMVVMNAFHHLQNHGSWIAFLFDLLPAILCGGLLLLGFCMWRRIDTISVANFAFMFAFLTARAMYYFLPLSLPKFLGDYVGPNTPFLGQGDQHGISYRGTLAFIAFVILYALLKDYINRRLGLTPSNPPPNTPPYDPSTSDGPFVPFDPYNLSKNRPLRPQ